MSLNYYQIKKNVRKARKLVIKGTTAAGSGHPGGSFSMAEIMGVLFNKISNMILKIHFGKTETD